MVKTKKPVQKAVKRLSLKKPGQLIVIILLAILVGLLVKQQVQINQDRQLFKQAEAKTEEVYSQIVATIGEPDKVVREKSCGRASRKFEQGPLSCSISIHSLVVISNVSDANKYLDDLSKLSSEPLRINALGQDLSSGFVKTPQQSPSQQFNQRVTSIKTISCNLSYEYPINNKSAYYELLEPEAPENLRIGVTCGGPAKTQHYPLRD